MANIKIGGVQSVLRQAGVNWRAAMVRRAVGEIKLKKITAAEIGRQTAHSPRGYYSLLAERGYQLMTREHPWLKKILTPVHKIDQLFGPVSEASQHDVMGMTLVEYPGAETLDRVGLAFPALARRFNKVVRLLEKNFRTPAGRPTPISLAEDNPGWATEAPDIRNIRGSFRQAVAQAWEEARKVEAAVDKKYGAGTMAGITDAVVVGIGANDMYLKGMPRLVNQDTNRRRRLFSVFSADGFKKLIAEAGLKPKTTLIIAISRSGNTEETLKTLNFNPEFKCLVSLVNKGPLKTLTEEKYDGQTLPIPGNIGGRYMWAKGGIVLVPLALASSPQAWKEYTEAMIEFDETYWPVGPRRTIVDLARHLYYYTGVYNSTGIFVCANDPLLEGELRIPLQIHNEGVGKVENRAMMFGPGMDLLPFAHAGQEAVLASAIVASTYGIFNFNIACDPDQTGLTEKVLLDSQKAHLGLTIDKFKLACVIPNWVKFSYAGGPNFALFSDGVSLRTLAIQTAFWQNLLYPYLIALGCNPDSNPNVAMVRSTTGKLLEFAAAAPASGLFQKIMEAIPGLMK